MAGMQTSVTFPKRWSGIAVISLTGLAAFIVYVVLSTPTPAEMIATFGSLASLIALVIALKQLRVIKRTSEATQEAVKDTHRAIINTLMVSDVSKALRMIEEIQSYAGNCKFESARLRLQDLQHLLIQFNNNRDVNLAFDEDRYKQLLATIGIDIYNLYNTIYVPGKSISVIALNKHLVYALQVLSDIESRLRFGKV